MAFFSHPIYNSEVSFSPLFRLLDDFDQYSRQTGKNSSNSTSPGGRRSPIFHWQPKFDLRETADAYELHGELPGLDKENISIEFPEEQHMIVRGKVERTYTSGTPPSSAGAVEGAPEKPAIADNKERRNSHKATVEDEADAKKSASGGSEVATSSNKSQNKTDASADKAKYWLTERSIGEFSRSFTFPTRIVQDDVSASLKDGILNVTVPKAKKQESRRIAIQ